MKKIIVIALLLVFVLFAFKMKGGNTSLLSKDVEDVPDAKDSDSELLTADEIDKLIQQKIKFYYLSGTAEANERLTALINAVGYGSGIVDSDTALISSAKDKIVAEDFISANSNFPTNVPIGFGTKFDNFITESTKFATALKNTGTEQAFKNLIWLKIDCGKYGKAAMSAKSWKQHERELCGDYGRCPMTGRDDSKVYHAKKVGERYLKIIVTIKRHHTALILKMETKARNLLTEQGYSL